MAKLITLCLALVGTPLFIVISALALLSFHSVDIDSSVVIIEMTRLAETPLLISLPLFIFAGTMLSESGAPGRILKLSQLLLGWLPGGLAVVTLMVCAVFTAFTGASGVTIFALGGLLLAVDDVVACHLVLAGAHQGQFDLILDVFDMNGAAGFVGTSLGHLEGFHHHALPGKGRIAVDQERQHPGARPVSQQRLLGPHLAQDHGIHRLQMAGIGHKADMDGFSISPSIVDALSQMIFAVIPIERPIPKSTV